MSDLMRMTVDIVSRALAAHQVPVEDVSGFITDVHAALYTAENPSPVSAAPVPKTRKRRVVAAIPASTEQVDANEVADSEEDDDGLTEITLGEDGQIRIPAKRPEPMFED